MNYVVIPASEVPGNERFEVRPRDAGQIVEVAYGSTDVWRDVNGEIRSLSKYRRTTDRSDGSVVYARLVSVDIEVKLSCVAFSGEPLRKNRLLVSDSTGYVRVFDSVAGHFTTCHSLSASAIRRARKAACPVAL